MGLLPVDSTDRSTVKCYKRSTYCLSFLKYLLYKAGCFRQHRPKHNSKFAKLPTVNTWHTPLIMLPCRGIYKRDQYSFLYNHLNKNIARTHLYAGSIFYCNQRLHYYFKIVYAAYAAEACIEFCAIFQG